MAVKIRLRRMGSKGKPFYRMVVADSRSPRDGRFIDMLGYYNPCCEPPVIKLDAEKVLLWLGRGAQPSDTCAALLKKENITAGKGSGKKKEEAAEVPAPPIEEAEKPKTAKKRTAKSEKEEAEKPEKAPAKKASAKAKAAEEETEAPAEAEASVEETQASDTVEAAEEKAEAPAGEVAAEEEQTEKQE